MWVFYRSYYQFAMIAMMLGSLSACLVGPDFEPPEPPKINHYTKPPWPCRTASAPGHGGASQQFIQAKTISAEWWRLFHSPKINKNICQWLTNSPNLKAAKATLFEAQENLKYFEAFPAFRFIPIAIGHKKHKISNVLKRAFVFFW